MAPFCSFGLFALVRFSDFYCHAFWHGDADSSNESMKPTYEMFDGRCAIIDLLVTPCSGVFVSR